MYKMNGRVRFREVGEDGRLTLPHLINYFQDCSTFHLEDIGLGTDYFVQQNLAFYILSWQIEINRLPYLGEEIKVGTLIYGCKGMFGYRNYIMYDVAGNILAYANLCGCFIDASTGKFVKLSEDEVEKYPIEEKIEMNYLPRKIKVPSSNQVLEPIRVRRHQIDVNAHVNNSQYVAMALDCLEGTETLTQIRVEYKRAAKLGDVIIPTVTREGQSYYVTLCDDQMQPYTVITFGV